MKPVYSIIDKLFSHAYSSSNWFKPTHFIWDFQLIQGDFVFITDLDIPNIDNYHFSEMKKYAWLVESPAVTPQSYEYVFNNSKKFDKIFTHSKKILDACDNAYLLPIGGCHIDQPDICLDHRKTKLVSMMYSYKNFAQGHGMRHEIASKYSNIVDVMGSGKTGQHLSKIESCRDYAFSVVVENCKDGYYFTEKIVDCFLTGVIPIYWGTDYIGDFFNKDGFITFNNVDELYSIIKDQNYLVDFYTNHMDEVYENYDNALKYKIAEDYLYTNYKNIL